jgi:hypothetical protein
VDGFVGGGVSAGAARGDTVVGLSEPNRSWRTYGGWVLAGDGERTVECRAREWSMVAGS